MADIHVACRGRPKAGQQKSAHWSTKVRFLPLKVGLEPAQEKVKVELAFVNKERNTEEGRIREEQCDYLGFLAGINLMNECIPIQSSSPN